MENPCVNAGEKSRPRVKKCCIWIAVFFLGALTGGFFGGWRMNDYAEHLQILQDSENVVRVNSSNYQFVNPLLECDIGSEVISQNRPKPTKSRLEKMIEEIKMQDRASFVSVYYRDLNNGPWVGINQSEPFYPASLLKVPVMMYYYKLAESDPSILSQKITFESGFQSANIAYYKPEQEVKAGDSFTVDELIQRMIVYSDNNAAEALMAFAQPKDPIQSVFQDIGLQNEMTGISTQISIKNYAMLLRLLFNSSYLHPDSSERALNLLSQAKFNQGITGKLPSDIVVSHKFGERESDDGVRQLHDCGIVYKTNFPYLVCIMTRGTDIEKLSGVIQDLSKEIYDEVSR